MLLVIDIGNTQTNIGVYDKDNLFANFRISTNKEETEDELAVTLNDLLSLKSLSLSSIDAVVLSSVVPSLTVSVRKMCKKILKLKPVVVGPGIKTGISILYDNPHEVGADRIANAVGAYELYGGPTIVVDFGTATTFDVVSQKGEYLGGAISPGLEISAEALFKSAARLSKVDLEGPTSVIGKNTKESIQAGVILGHAGLVDAIVTEIKKELKETPKVIATGGLASLVVPYCKTVDKVDPFLTLAGLKKIYEKNCKK